MVFIFDYNNYNLYSHELIRQNLILFYVNNYYLNNSNDYTIYFYKNNFNKYYFILLLNNIYLIFLNFYFYRNKIKYIDIFKNIF